MSSARKRIMLLGKTSSGKTTLIKALMNESLDYKKTQAIDYLGDFVDTPGEYIEMPRFYRALLVTSYSCDIICFTQDATSSESLFPPRFSSAFNKDIVGIVTKSGCSEADTALAEKYLRTAGAARIFHVSALEGLGIGRFKEYLQTEGAFLIEGQSCNC